ncbi:MAG: hypothetical protein M1491_03960 [Deltaproteobacteria bacterium]|nr:hypothetical protein [Deltaproteobacteria bacterium]
MLDNLGMLYLIKGDYKQARQIAGRLKPLKPALSKELKILLQKIQAKQYKEDKENILMS